MLLSGNVIIVTGGASGIGQECAKAYVKEGAQVAVLDLQETVPDRMAGDEPVLYVQCDVSDEAQVAAAVEKVIARFGKIDAVHNNAGIASPSKTLHDTTVSEWRRFMDVNLFSIYFTTKYALPYLKITKGCILNTSSMVGEIGQAQHAAYAASKGAVNALTKSMALDYAPMGIRVNAVAPAGVWTPALRKWATEQPDAGSIETYLDAIHILGYCPGGDVVADACVFLISGKARFITGCIMPVSGGAELGYRK
ncbi:SDR family NAD(P)-dependent oxidoreductase [Niabella soli]|uniref:Short-chain dehydrogenase n=1 Tax=Niabella soli DSM 19437 TaxID=929713 RepID=W0F0Z1_9BACT|nr:SDR family oxidoreductase [Niabella soli]AHF16700.1 short-chain dehydrogenase [Niabella soli DSM 19437]